MDVSKLLECYYQPGKPGIIDAINPDTGLGLYGKHTLAETRVEYPGAEIGDFDTVVNQQDAYWRKPPVEITRERFWEMLEVLPPEDWRSNGDHETFKLMEYTSGNITAIFCRIGERYWEMQDSVFLSSAQIVEKCRALI